MLVRQRVAGFELTIRLTLHLQAEFPPPYLARGIRHSCAPRSPLNPRTRRSLAPRPFVHHSGRAVRSCLYLSSCISAVYSPIKATVLSRQPAIRISPLEGTRTSQVRDIICQLCIEKGIRLSVGSRLSFPIQRFLYEWRGKVVMVLGL